MRFSVFVLVLLVSSTVAGQVDLGTPARAEETTPTKCASPLPQFEVPFASARVDDLRIVKPKPWKFRDAYKRAACTGYSCGCYDAEAECFANCPPEGQPGHLDCITDCGRESRRCGICCCCDPSQWCPAYCS
jgi:hypothetical protein